MKEYFSHAAYIRWYRQYQINLNQIRTQFDSLRLPVETIPFPEHTRQLLQEEIDEIDIAMDSLYPRNFVQGAKPLESRELFLENNKLIMNFFFNLFKAPYFFDSIYEQEKKSVLKKYKESNIKEKLMNFRQHIDEAIMVQMKKFSGNASESSAATQTA